MNNEKMIFHLNETRNHVTEVQKNIAVFVNDLTSRAIKHDESKFQSPEKEDFAELTPKLRDTTYGSEEYRELLKALGPALKHHYACSSHHPEFYENGVDGMDLLDLIEMFADWLAATKRHADGDMMRSIDHNEKRFNMSPQLVQIFRNTFKRYFDEKKTVK